MRVLAALVSGVAVAALNIAADIAAQGLGWWRYPAVDDRGYGPVDWYVAAAVAVAGLTLIGWRAHRRFGPVGTVGFPPRPGRLRHPARLGGLARRRRCDRLRARADPVDRRLPDLVHVHRCRARRAGRAAPACGSRSSTAPAKSPARRAQIRCRLTIPLRGTPRLAWLSELPGEVFKVGRLGLLVGPGPDIFSGEGRPLHLCICGSLVAPRLLGSGSVASPEWPNLLLLTYWVWLSQWLPSGDVQAGGDAR